MGRGKSTTTATVTSRSSLDTERRRKEVEARLTAYRREIRSIPNAVLIDQAAGEILGAAILESRGHDDGGLADGCAMACYEEALRRGNKDLYTRAYNRVAANQGHDGMAKPVSVPIDVGDPALATDGGGDGAYHLIDMEKTSLISDGERRTLCESTVRTSTPVRRRDEIAPAFLCTECLAAEEAHFTALRGENGLTEAYDLAVG